MKSPSGEGLILTIRKKLYAPGRGSPRAGMFSSPV